MAMAQPQAGVQRNSNSTLREEASAKVDEKKAQLGATSFMIQDAAQSENPMETAKEHTHTMEQMGAKRIGQLAIGIGVVGIVLNKMSALDIVNNSSGVVDVGSIFDTAGEGLNLLVLGVIIAAAAVLLSLWSGF